MIDSSLPLTMFIGGSNRLQSVYLSAPLSSTVIHKYSLIMLTVSVKPFKVPYEPGLLNMKKARYLSCLHVIALVGKDIECGKASFLLGR